MAGLTSLPYALACGTQQRTDSNGNGGWWVVGAAQSLAINVYGVSQNRKASQGTPKFYD